MLAVLDAESHVGHVAEELRLPGHLVANARPGCATESTVCTGHCGKNTEGKVGDGVVSVEAYKGWLALPLSSAIWSIAGERHAHLYDAYETDSTDSRRRHKVGKQQAPDDFDTVDPPGVIGRVKLEFRLPFD